jgi:lycopene beta-cyclase
MPKHYDFILAGGGLAGLSLACHLVASPLRDRSILIVDPEPKERNDRTWSYWTNHAGLFDGAVAHSWDRLRFVGGDGEIDVALGDYRYRTIRGDDFYRFARRQLAACPTVEFLRGRVERIEDGPAQATVVVAGQALTCDWVFDSRPVAAKDERYTHLKLTFRGWEVETTAPAFDTSAATFLDFRTPAHGDVRFFYVLPFAANRALVEYTLFTPARVTRGETEQAIAGYLHQVLGIENYRILSQEGGCLPVTDQPMPRRLGKRILAVGIRGGRLKPSTGFAFTRVQDDSAAIVASLQAHGHPFDLPEDAPLFHMLDSILLRVMAEHPGQIEPAFAAMFGRNPVERILRFLDEQAQPAEVVEMIATLPRAVFVRTALRHYGVRALGLMRGSAPKSMAPARSTR